MTPPTATAASAAGCQELDGGWQATFLVTLTGGRGWAVVPQRGPVSRAGGDQWSIVVLQPKSGGTGSVTLSAVQVGGGIPFRTATVVLGPGVATTVACPS
jgi:hypothetical protein